MKPHLVVWTDVPIHLLLLVASHGGFRPRVLRQASIGEVQPHDPERAELGRHRPHDVHDPHVLVLLVANQVGGDQHRTHEPKQQEGN